MPEIYDISSDGRYNRARTSAHGATSSIAIGPRPCMLLSSVSDARPPQDGPTRFKNML